MQSKEEILAAIDALPREDVKALMKEVRQKVLQEVQEHSAVERVLLKGSDDDIRKIVKGR